MHNLMCYLCMVFLCFLTVPASAQKQNATWILQIANGQGSSPVPREYHTLTYVHNATNGNNSNAVLFGGQAQDRSIYFLNDTWILRFPRSGWLKLDLPECPPARSHHAAVHYGREAVIFGGRDAAGVSLGDVWRFDTENRTWARDKDIGANISPRHSHQTARVGSSMFVFGGIVDKIGEANDLWVYNLTDMMWTEIDTLGSPAPRHGATLTYFESELGPSLILIGGTGINGLGFNDVWQFLIEQNKWVLLDAGNSQTGPERRFGHTAIAETTSPGSAQIVIFGGSYVSPAGQLVYYNDVWVLRLTGATSSWAALIRDGLPEGPSKRVGHASFRAGRESFTFGGYGQTAGLLNDLWLLDYGF